MPPSKKLHYFDMSDVLNWPNQERIIQRRTKRPTLVGPPVSNQPEYQNGSKSTKPNEEEKSSRSLLRKGLRSHKPSKTDSNLLEEKEPQPAAAWLSLPRFLWKAEDQKALEGGKKTENTISFVSYVVNFSRFQF
ncbi:hypothetical protein Tco_1336291 [Tanacetum coccineum]